MSLPSIVQSAGAWARRSPLRLGLLVAAIVVALFLINRKGGPAPNATQFFDVKRGDFLISVVEGGNVEAVHEEIIRCEVEGTARIIFIVPEGTYVKKDQLLVELDSLAVQDAVNQQMINVEKAQFAVVQAEQQLVIQQSTADSEEDAAKLQVEFAETALNKYIKGEADQLRRNAQIEITNTLENLEIAKERLGWTEKLYQKGYETKANLDKDRLAVSQTTLKLEQANKALWMIVTFDEPKKKRELEAALQAAKEDLARVKLQGERKIAQFKADLETQKATLELSKKKLERDQKQLLATKIKAPCDGLVVYSSGGGRFSSESMIEEGAVVRNRQELIKLPDTSEMKLQVKIHESHINQIRIGQAAYVVLDAMPDQRFRGVVNRVAPLPDGQSRFGNPNLKVYATEVLVTDKLPDVKPGVSARAEIVITNLSDVLTVPIQAVTTRKGRQVVFLADAPQKPVPVSVGMYNNKFIEIVSGLTPGNRVMLSPPFDTEEKDLGGAIIANGEAVPQATNQVPGKTLTPEMTGGPRGPRMNGNAPGAALAPGVPPAPGVALEPTSFGQGQRRRGEGGPDTAAAPGGSRPQFNREEMMKQFDKNGDGELDETERAAMREKFPRGDGSGGNRPQFNREEMMKQFDKNGDGELDETERAAMRERFGRGARGPGSGTNRPADFPSASSRGPGGVIATPTRAGE